MRAVPHRLTIQSNYQPGVFEAVKEERKYIVRMESRLYLHSNSPLLLQAHQKNLIVTLMKLLKTFIPFLELTAVLACLYFISITILSI